MKKSGSLFFIFSACILLMFFMSGTECPAADDTARRALSNEDCAKCHPGPPADIAANGKKHQMVPCTDCHVGHPPKVKKPIPACSQCHQGKPHYELEKCLGCHTNPHTPLKITMQGDITAPCGSCHGAQLKQLKENKSRHTAFACTSCHTGIHRSKIDCMKCHKPHASKMTKADCRICHKAHMPVPVTYGDISSSLCASCHKKVLDVLSASETKHRLFSCSFCHNAKHRAVPKCQQCHKEKHAQGIRNKFPSCNECHKVAHDLNNWPAPAPARKDADKKPAKKQN